MRRRFRLWLWGSNDIFPVFCKRIRYMTLTFITSHDICTTSPNSPTSVFSTTSPLATLHPPVPNPGHLPQITSFLQLHAHGLARRVPDVTEIHGTNHLPSLKLTLVGGFNPSQNYARQIGSFPQVVGMNIKNYHLEQI